MTNTVNDNDPRVSGAYREMASEQTPAELDRKVLAMAAAAARGGQGLPRSWFRPLAWAATIALSFALVLEINQVRDVPPVNEATSPRSDTDLADLREESPRPAEATERQKNEAVVNQQLNKRTSDAPSAGKAAITPSRPQAAAMDAAVTSPAPERARGVLAETEELTDRCSQEARESAETWYECVRLMREAGHTESAQLELAALLVEFPDFEEPTGDASGPTVR